MIASNYAAKDPDVSVIIVTLGKRISEFKACLNSILRQTYKDFEIIIVNDGPPEPIKTIAHSLNSNDRIVLIHNLTQVGPAVARNIATHYAKGKYLAFIDDDSIADENWLETLIQAYENPRVGGVGGTTIQFYSRRIKQKSKFSLAVDTLYERIDDVTDTEFLCGTNMSFRRDIFEEVGGFDEYLGKISFFEDTDISLSVKEKGYKLMCQPAAIVVHYDISHGGCTPRVDEHWYWFSRNRLYVVLKHPKFFYSIITITYFSVNCFLKFFRRCVANRHSPKTWFMGIFYIFKGLIEAIIVHFINKK
ncbi:glycosyltransferase family 2 protein [Candidatus Bathyarchaeota archaeon]|nr:glycosyltransferase family 2 protein [Candidatus Bathyarchaeota archaeon]